MIGVIVLSKPQTKYPTGILEILKTVDQASSKAVRHSQRVVFLGTGALTDWSLGRKLFRKMKRFIEDEVSARLGESCVVECHWLGYRGVDLPYDAMHTLSPIEQSAFSVQKAMASFPDAIIDFVCHSLSGLIVMYWCLKIASHDDLKRINSIVTINSPLRAFDIWSEACQVYIETHGNFLSQRAIPAAAIDLKGGSLVSGLGTRWNLPIYLLNICSTGDILVPPEIARLDGCALTYEFDGLKWRDPLNRHRQALLDRNVQNEVVNTICADHLLGNGVCQYSSAPESNVPLNGRGC